MADNNGLISDTTYTEFKRRHAPLLQDFVTQIRRLKANYGIGIEDVMAATPDHTFEPPLSYEFEACQSKWEEVRTAIRAYFSANSEIYTPLEEELAKETMGLCRMDGLKKKEITSRDHTVTRPPYHGI